MLSTSLWPKMRRHVFIQDCQDPLESITGTIGTLNWHKSKKWTKKKPKQTNKLQHMLHVFHVTVRHTVLLFINFVERGLCRGQGHFTPQILRKCCIFTPGLTWDFKQHKPSSAGSHKVIQHLVLSLILVYKSVMCTNGQYSSISHLRGLDAKSCDLLLCYG